jgi:hypothetical protein
MFPEESKKILHFALNYKVNISEVDVEKVQMGGFNLLIQLKCVNIVYHAFQNADVRKLFLTKGFDKKNEIKN